MPNLSKQPFLEVARDTLREHPSLCFLSFAVTVALLCVLVFFIPVINDSLEALTGFDVLRRLGTESTVGPRKRALYETVLLAGLALTALLYVLSLLQSRGRVLRTLLMLVVAAQYVLLYQTSQRINFSGRELVGWERALKRLHLTQLPAIEYDEVFGKQHVPIDDLDSFNAFHSWVKQRYLAHKSVLQERWQITNDDRLKTIYYMNQVSGLWAFGNRNNPEAPGCVLVNEENNWSEPSPQSINVQTYLKANIGCCVDYAFLLKFLLDQDQIENRITEYTGHTFNEVMLENAWRVVDANTNLLFESSWEEMLNEHNTGPDSISVTLFPHSNLVGPETSHYRSELGRFRLELLMIAARRATWNMPIVRRELPDYFTLATDTDAATR